ALPASTASRNLRIAVFTDDFTALLRRRRCSFCRFRLIWDLMFATEYEPRRWVGCLQVSSSHKSSGCHTVTRSSAASWCPATARARPYERDGRSDQAGARFPKACTPCDRRHVRAGEREHSTIRGPRRRRESLSGDEPRAQVVTDTTGVCGEPVV